MTVLSHATEQQTIGTHHALAKKHQPRNLVMQKMMTVMEKPMKLADSEVPAQKEKVHAE
jgi:hypothetical protein